MLWNPKHHDISRVWGLRLSETDLVFSVSLRFDALLQVHTSPEARYRSRCIRTDRWAVGETHLGIDGVLERRSARYCVEYRVNLESLVQASAAHAVVTLGHCFRVLNLCGDETLNMEVSDPQDWWLEDMQIAGISSALQVSVTPSAAEQIARMQEASFQLTAPIMARIRARATGLGNMGRVRVEREPSRTPYFMMDEGSCTCFGAGGEIYQAGQGYELNSHNFRFVGDLLATLVGLAHLSTVMDNTRTAN